MITKSQFMLKNFLNILSTPTNNTVQTVSAKVGSWSSARGAGGYGLPWIFTHSLLDLPNLKIFPFLIVNTDSTLIAPSENFSTDAYAVGPLEKCQFKSSFFTLDQNVGISLICILTKFKLSSPSRFQDIAVQN